MLGTVAVRLRLLADLVDLLLPLACELCGVAGEGPLCASCHDRIPQLEGRLCRRCGLPMASVRADECAGCRIVPPRFARARAVAPYEGLVLEAIHRFKYDRVRGLAGPLGALLVERDPYRDEARRDDVVVPVPLGARRAERGFNQAALLALRYARASGRRVGLDVLRRSRRSARQAGASRGARRVNVAAAFRTHRPSAIAGRHVLLLDDVITTGATADACASSLLDSGALEVRVLALARTLERRPLA